MRYLILMTALAWSGSIHACNCALKSNYNKQVCVNARYNAATGFNGSNYGGAGGSGGSAASNSSSTSSAAARADAAAASRSSATVNAVNGGNVQSTSDVVERSAPPVSLGIIAPNGCGAGVQGGGSNTRGAMLAGFAWTTGECYAFILAQSYQAVGQLEAACLVLNTTNAAKRAESRGIKLPDCTVTRVVTVQTPGTYTREQVDAIVHKATSK